MTVEALENRLNEVVTIAFHCDGIIEVIEDYKKTEITVYSIEGLETKQI